MHLKSLVFCYFLVLSIFFLGDVAGTCAGLYPPYIPLPPTSIPYEEMETCCWFADETCCGLRDDLYDLSSIDKQIKDIGARGVNDQCYIKLSSLFCFWCDPNTSEFLSLPTAATTGRKYATLVLCPSFCDELFFKCFPDLDLIVNDFTQIHTSKQFCEEVILDNFYENKDDIFPEFRITVGRVDGINCMGGIDDDEIETEAGICLPIPSSGLVSSSHEFAPFVFAPSVNAGCLFLSSVALTMITLLFLL